MATAAVLAAAWLSVTLPMQSVAPGEVIAAVRFHGNYSIPDAELMALAGVQIGDPLTPTTLADIEHRLRADQRVGSVEIRKRYRSLARSDDVVLVILVSERVATHEKLMFLPALGWTDEHGITYGARLTTIDLLGIDERLSFPLTWGGEKHAGVEFGRDFEAAPVSRATVGFDVLRQTNPHFDLDDTRVRLRGEAAKRWGLFELDGSLGWADVRFGGQDEGARLTYGVAARLDGRQDVNLPRDVGYVGAGWERLDLVGAEPSFDIYTADLRAYKGLVGRSILALQALYRGADGRLPDSERFLLGGAQTLRGHDAGQFAGDNLVLLAAEVRVPITPPIPVGLAGFELFFDSGAVYDHGTALRKAQFRNGVGGGFFILAAVVGFKIDVAWDLHDDVHVHFGTGFRF